MEFEAAQHRLQELEEDDEVEEDIDLRRLPRSSARRRIDYDDDYLDDDNDYYERGPEIQQALYEKEERLAAQARRRLHRAKLRGESSVTLSRAELDAMERSDARERAAQQQLLDEQERAVVSSKSSKGQSRKSMPSEKNKSKKQTVHSTPRWLCKQRPSRCLEKEQKGCLGRARREQWETKTMTRTRGLCHVRREQDCSSQWEEFTVC